MKIRMNIYYSIIIESESYFENSALDIWVDKLLSKNPGMKTGLISIVKYSQKEASDKS